MIRLGVSQCLLGDHVRYDGGHKRDDVLLDRFASFVEWVKVCPEVESGMTTPREPVRLVSRDGRVRMVTARTGVDHTDAMTAYARRRIENMVTEDLCGYVLKKDSPSCGMERVTLYRDSGRPTKSGTGIFAAALRARFPNMPIEDEGRLSDGRLRENFVERVFAYRRLRDLFERRWTVRDLVRFHAAHELVLRAHSPSAHARLSRIVSRAGALPRPVVRAEYSAAFMRALANVPTRQRHTRVLRYVVRHFVRMLDPESRAELLAVIEGYLQGRQTIAAPMSLVRYHLGRLNAPLLARQVYFDPYPSELMLHAHE